MNISKMTEYKMPPKDLFGKRCRIQHVSDMKNGFVYRIVNSGIRSNSWKELPLGRYPNENINHGQHSEEVLIVVCDTLIDENSKLERVALKDVLILEEDDETKIEFKQYVDLINVGDSMELDSGQIIAEMQYGNISASLEVRGDVKVTFDDQTYLCPSDFPQKLKEMIHTDRNWYNSKSVYVSENNWFELFVSCDGSAFPDADCVDAENLKPIDVFGLLYEAIVSKIKELKGDKN